MTKWGSWVRVTDDKRPAELTDDDEHIQCIYINGAGDLMTDGTGDGYRTAGTHIWSAPDMPNMMTLAYRRLA